MEAKSYSMIIIAFSASIIAILAQISIPLPIIPITGQTLAIGLIATILKPSQSIKVVILYLLLGATGLPVFANFTGGVGILFGPRGGYLWSFILTAYAISQVLVWIGYSVLKGFIANFIGLCINLTIGSIWLMFYLQVDFKHAFIVGFVPFFVIGIIKAWLAALFGITLRKRLIVAKLIRSSF